MDNINNILKYENQEVIDRFLRIYQIEYCDAQIIFKELLKFLYLSDLNIEERKMNPNIPILTIFSFNTIIDEMWHNFILFTNDYSLFCKKYLNNFIHHAPSTKVEKEKTTRLGPNDLQIIVENQMNTNEISLNLKNLY